MIRFLEYIGDKDQKSINISLGKTVVFPKGQVVDIVEAGMNERKAREILKSGLFKLHGSSQPVPLEVKENVCPCGFQAKTLAGLKAHQRKCLK